jgi:hypothetical protein
MKSSSIIVDMSIFPFIHYSFCFIHTHTHTHTHTHIDNKSKIEIFYLFAETTFLFKYIYSTIKAFILWKL